MQSFYVEDQITKLFEAWKCKEPLPTKKTQVVIAFPPGPGIQFNQITITKSSMKSTYGKSLWVAVFEHK